MAVSATDIVVYGSATMADDDVTTQIGGAIDTTVRLVFTDISPAGLIEVVSSNAGDTTQTLTVYGRNSAGELISEAKTVNGLSVIDFTTTFERLLKATLSGAGAGTITLRKDGNAGDLMVFEAGVTEIRRPFYNAVAEGSGGAQRTYYEKVFFKNNNGTSSLTNAVISEFADPTTKVTFDLESSLNGTDDNGGGNNRQVAPGGYTFDSAAKDVANSKNHSPSSAQGVWLKLTLDPGDLATNSYYTLRETGETA